MSAAGHFGFISYCSETKGKLGLGRHRLLPTALRKNLRVSVAGDDETHPSCHNAKVLFRLPASLISMGRNRGLRAQGWSSSPKQESGSLECSHTRMTYIPEFLSPLYCTRCDPYSLLGGWDSLKLPDSSAGFCKLHWVRADHK